MALRVPNNYNGFTFAGTSESLLALVTSEDNFSHLGQSLALCGLWHIKHPTILILGQLVTLISPLGLSYLA